MDRPRDIVLTILLCLAGIALSALIFGPQTIVTYTGANDFVGFYTAGKLALSPDLYDVRAFMEAQAGATGLVSDQILFVRLPWQALAFAPFTILPFAAAHITWTIVCILALCGFAACFPRVPLKARAIAICWTIPVFVCLAVGQDVPLVLLALGTAFLLIEHGYHVPAGLCLALCLAKPHLVWPLAIALVWSRMWRVCAGGVVGCLVLLGASFMTAGPSWIQRCAQVMRYADLHARLVLMPTLHSALLTVANRGAIEIVVSVILLAAILRGATWKQSAAIALTVAVVLGRHAFIADCALLLPALFLLWSEPRARGILLVLISPLTFIPGIFFSPAWIVGMLSAGALCLAAARDPIRPINT